MEQVTEQSSTDTTDSSMDSDLVIPAGINPAYAKKNAKTPEPRAEAEPEAQEPKETKTAQEEKKVEAALKKLKIKGREMEVDDSKYHEYAQKGAAATETWQEAAKMKREAEAFIHELKTNPMKVLKDPNLGVDMRKIAEEFIWEQMQEESLSPEQIQQRERDKELEEYRSEKQRLKQQEEQQKMSELDEHYSADYDKRITTALQTAGLPRTVGTVRRITDYMLNDVRKGVERDMTDYLDLVREDYFNDFNEFFDQTDGDRLMKFLGDKNLKKIRESDLKKLKTTTPQQGHTFVPGKGMVSAKPQKKLGGEDWVRQVRKEMMGK
jgi:hypothetical protein